ncbi:MAG: hypothetical protein OSA98_12660 [Rubripirellula sp.]|nr:hypothetical protein [Rubripirellula sp.]
MKVFIPVLMVVLSLAPVLGAGSSHVFADRCVVGSSVAAFNQRFTVDGRWDPQSGWSYSLSSLETGKTQDGPLSLIGRHAHLHFFLSADGKRFAVLDATAGRHLANRLMTYTSDGKLISSLGVRDLLTPSEQAKIMFSVSHLRWLKWDPEPQFSDAVVEQERDSVILPAANPYGKYNSQKKMITFTTLAGRKVSVALADGRVIQRAQTDQEGSEEE